MYEVKADALEESFEALEREDEEVAALKEEGAALKARFDAQDGQVALPPEGLRIAGSNPHLPIPKAGGGVLTRPAQIPLPHRLRRWAPSQSQMGRNQAARRRSAARSA